MPCKETQIDNTNYLNDAALYSSAKIDNGIIKVVLDYNNMLVDISNIIDSVTSGTVAFKVNNWSGEAVYSEESSLTSPFSFTVTNGAENYSGSYCLEFPECASGE